MKKLSGILFDFNGTLLFDSHMHMEAFRRVFPEFGVPAPTEEYMINKVFGRTNAQIFYENCDPNGSAEACEAFRVAKERAYYDICLSSPEKFRLADGVSDMLDYLKRNGVPYCMATGSGKDEVNFFMTHLGIDRWFSWDNIVYTDGTFKGKPEPDCYILAARRLSLATKDCIVFEDGASGIRAARSAGAGAIIAVYEQGIPAPIGEPGSLDGEYHSFADWHSILAGYGL